MKKQIFSPLLISVLLAGGCAVGPDYEKPAVETPASFKETGDWKPAEPKDDIDRGAWWKIYNDPILNALEGQIDISNQNLKQAEANYRAAVAIADQTRASLFPTVTGSASVMRGGHGGHSGVNTYNLSAAGNWTLDVWGQIRRQLENAEANAEASAATLASARLSAQAELATDYFALRIQDEQQRLLSQTVEDDQKILDIIKNQYAVGVASQADVSAAETTLENAHAQAIATGVARSQLEHAIAVLIGTPASTFSLAPIKTVEKVPTIPPQVPSVLLERRPDIANAERLVAAANAEIGVAVAAYFPTVALSGTYFFGTSIVGVLASAASQVWSVGASASETLIEFGARQAAVDEAQANFDASVAFYRQTVLAAFQNVEDNLAAQRILVDQEKAQNAATQSARQSEEVSLNQYKAGVVAYTALLVAQTTRLSNEQLSITVHGNRLAASVALIEALGGGWDVSQLPK